MKGSTAGLLAAAANMVVVEWDKSTKQGNDMKIPATRMVIVETVRREVIF